MKKITPYKKIKTTKEIIMKGSSAFIKPVATLSDGYGVCQIIKDDDCYVICLRQTGGRYKATTHIFKEVFEVLCQLPEL